jgi:hypothetical protein
MSQIFAVQSAQNLTLVSEVVFDISVRGDAELPAVVT